MNMKTIIILLCFTFAILSGVPKSFARPQYLGVFNEVYGRGSCSTCHVMVQGDRITDHNGSFRPDFPNRTYEPRNFNRTNESYRPNRTGGFRNSNRTLQLNSYGTLFENQPDHNTDPRAALLAIGPPPTGTAAPADTPAEGTGAQAAPGFEVMIALAGLFACAFMAKRHNR